MLIQIIFLVVIVLVASFVVPLLKDSRKEKINTPLSFNKKSYFFSVAERKFYDVLKEIAHELNYELFAKIRWADVIYSDSKGKEWWSNWGKIKSKHIDFLLCDKENYSPVIAIELDDSSHLTKGGVKRDGLETEVLNLAGLKLVRFKVQENYSREEIKAILTKNHLTNL